MPARSDRTWYKVSSLRLLTLMPLPSCSPRVAARATGLWGTGASQRPQKRFDLQSKSCRWSSLMELSSKSRSRDSTARESVACTSIPNTRSLDGTSRRLNDHALAIKDRRSIESEGLPALAPAADSINPKIRAPCPCNSALGDPVALGRFRYFCTPWAREFD